jgi:1,6-anhydro-N-acetylmuramate kinase
LVLREVGDDRRAREGRARLDESLWVPHRSEGPDPGYVGPLVDATATTVAQLLARTGLRRVVLSGGSMQNRLLERGLAERLTGHLVMAHDIPLNDGGIALGQAHAAVLTLLSEST